MKQETVLSVAILTVATLLIHSASSKPLLFESAWREALRRNFVAAVEGLEHHSVVAVSPQASPLAAQAGSSRLRGLTCEVCKEVVSFAQYWSERGSTHEQIEKLATTTCIYLGIETERVCIGIDEVLTVFENLILSPDEVCGILVGSECGTPYDPLANWNISLPDTPKPPVIPHVLPKPGAPTLRVLHLTDIHLDSSYVPGSKADCGEPLCCRANDGKPDPGNSGAGQYGDYRDCDTPLWTLELLFSHLQAKQDEFDYILWTGDLPAHDIWNQTHSSQTELLQMLSTMLVKYFPNKPIFPSLGNHESAPVNSFPPRFVKGSQSISWLYDALADSWKAWLPEETMTTIRQGAYYTVSPYPGLRIVSINMNTCNNENWWLLLNMTDPYGQLAWLIQVLQKAEDNKEKVHIVGHIPPGITDCLKAWSHNYYKIVDRYESTITGQFFGHTHKDHYELMGCSRP
ncbi:hypothetical protein BaRGS_00030115 [Batillaria attramentaria]|uniref:Saposin B-type domain-containing protein n=1 Tax=Batillaria attramentaria TaxID=370345 RepID=A0ABD0JVG1_9CAEN